MNANHETEAMTDEGKVREALRVLAGMTGNRGDDEFVAAAQNSFERLRDALWAKGFTAGYQRAVEEMTESKRE